jgi:hypothetical protein
MRILWVGKASRNASAGDEVYDRKVISGIRARGHTVIEVNPSRVSKSRSLINLIFRRIPHYRSWYDCDGNYAALKAASYNCDAALVSWEPFDKLAYSLAIPTIPILHNITSSSLPAFLQRSVIARLLAWHAKQWEDTCYSSANFLAVACLSLTDLAGLQRRFPGIKLLHCPPGSPSPIPLSDDATVRSELVITGTYGWRAKRRDALRFAREYARVAGRLEVFADALPAEANRLLSSRPIIKESTGNTIRFGIITDRFAAGHKLKTTEYIAGNCIVLTFAEIEEDFHDIPDREFFIRKLSHASEIGSHVAEVNRVDVRELRSRFSAFKRRCLDRFDWQLTSDYLLAALTERAT